MPITVPAYSFVFATESGNQPASQLDSNFNTIRTAMTGVALQASDLIDLYGVRGLVGSNNSVTPNTKYDLSADLVVLRNPSGGLNVQTATGTLTNDTGLAGPSAGGRDQVAAFGGSTWIHFYFIWSGTTLSTLSSIVAPPTGPTLPIGYTHWAYAGAVFYNVTPLLLNTRMRGSWIFYPNANADGVVLTAGAAVVETAVSVSSVVPPNASQYLLGTNGAGGWNMTSSAGGVIDTTLVLRAVTGLNVKSIRWLTQGLSGAFVNINLLPEITMPNIGQQFFYAHVVTTGTLPTLALSVTAYQIPNGG